MQSGQKIILIIAIMALSLWGLLGKSQDNNETIEQAIARLISAHEADAEAHLSASGSLQSHKASEILDHLAESIVNDKLYPHARAHVAIVAPGSDGDYDDIPAALAYADSVGGGTVLVKRGRYTLSEDLQLGRGVDLVGEGMGETILDFGAGNYGVKGYKTRYLGARSFDVLTFTQGSRVITFPAGTNLLDPERPVWPGMYVEDNASGYGLYVESVDSATQITATEAWTEATTTTEGIIRVAAQCAQGSRVVTFPAGTQLLTFGMESQFTFIEDAFETFSSEIESIDSETQLTLRDAYTGDYPEIYIDIQELYPPQHEICNLSLSESAAAFVVDAVSSCALHISGVEFKNCAGLVRNQTTSYIRSLIEQCYFAGCSGPVLFDIDDATIENNRGVISAANVGMFACKGDIRIVGNKIGGSSATGLTVIHTGYRNLVLEQNFFYGITTFFSGTIYTTGGNSNWRISANRLQSKSGQNCDFNLKYSNIIGNNIYTTGGGRPRLPAGSERNSFTGNYLQYNYTDAGTGNIETGTVYLYA